MLKITRRQAIAWAAASTAAMGFPAILRAQSLEQEKITIAVGGKPLFYYLPLSIAEEKGFFKDEGLQVKIVDFAGGSKSLQAVLGGSADVVSGAFEHTISMHAKGQPFRAFVAQGRTPLIVFGVSKKTMPDYKSVAELKGKRIGVSAPGSSTNVMASLLLTKHGINPKDVSFVGVGTGVSALNAMRSGQIDAITSLDPVTSMLVGGDEMTVVVDTRSVQETIDLYGGEMPSSCLYAPEDFIVKKPNVTQALTNAIVRADKWIQQAGVEEIAQTVPSAYLLGDPALYKTSLGHNLQGLSPDGMFPEDGAQTALKVLAAFTPRFEADKVDTAKAWTNDFVRVANQKYPNA